MLIIIKYQMELFEYKLQKLKCIARRVQTADDMLLIRVVSTLLALDLVHTHDFALPLDAVVQIMVSTYRLYQYSEDDIPEKRLLSSIIYLLYSMANLENIPVEEWKDIIEQPFQEFLRVLCAMPNLEAAALRLLQNISIL